MGTRKPNLIEECLKEKNFNQEEAEVFLKILQMIKTASIEPKDTSIEEKLDKIITDLVVLNEI